MRSSLVQSGRVSDPMIINSMIVAAILVLAAGSAVVNPGFNAYLRERNLDESSRSMLVAVFFGISAAVVLLVGVVADKKGSKTLILAGLGTLALSQAIHVFAVSFAAIFVARVLVGLGFALFGGVAMSLLLNSLDAAKTKVSKDAWQSVSTAGSCFVGAIATIFGGVLSGIDSRLPFIVSGSIFGALFLLGLCLREPPRSTEDKGGFACAYRFCLQRYSLQRWLIVAASALAALLNVAWFFYEPCFREVGFSALWFGVIMAGYEVLASLASLIAGFVKGGRKLPTMFCASLLAVAVAYLLLGSCSAVIAVAVGAIFPIVRGYVSVIFGSALYDQTPKMIRATVLSVQNSLASVMSFAASLPLGFGVQVFGLSAALLIVALVCLAVMAGVLALKCKQ